MNTTAADLTAAIASADMDRLASVVVDQLGEGWTLKRQSEWVFWVEFGALRTPRGVYAGPRIRVTYVPAGAAEVTIRGRLYRRTERVTRAGAAVFEAADVA